MRSLLLVLFFTTQGINSMEIPILKNHQSSALENIVMTTLRDKTTTTDQFREATKKLGPFLVAKVVSCIDLESKHIETPISGYMGVESPEIELVSILRSGDALIDSFTAYFPKAAVSKILIQRDEETAAAHFLYMKLSPTLAKGNHVVITEPMLATGGSLKLALSLLLEKGVKEENIIIACVCASAVGLKFLNEHHPKISVVAIGVDDELNEKKWIVPGLGDFGDRFYGTMH